MKNFDMKIFLYNISNMILSDANRAKEDLEKSLNKERDVSVDFDRGRKMAYYEVLSTLKTYAEVNDIPLKAINMDGINPDKDYI